MSTLTSVPSYHVFLASHPLEGDLREPFDLTPDRDLSYPAAREILLAFARMYPVLHTSGFRSFLEILPVAGDR